MKSDEKGGKAIGDGPNTNSYKDLIVWKNGIALIIELNSPVAMM